MRDSTVGSCASAGRYSLCTIEGGTCQVGLMVMNFIVSLRSGVGMLGLPMTIRVVHTCAPSCITLSVKSGWLTTTCAEPRSRGYQRQRSMLARIVSIWRELSPFLAPAAPRSSASTALSLRYSSCCGLKESSTLPASCVAATALRMRSEEHTSELQSLRHLV